MRKTIVYLSLSTISCAFSMGVLAKNNLPNLPKIKSGYDAVVFVKYPANFKEKDDYTAKEENEKIILRFRAGPDSTLYKEHKKHHVNIKYKEDLKSSKAPHLTDDIYGAIMLDGNTQYFKHCGMSFKNNKDFSKKSRVLLTCDKVRKSGFKKTN